LRLSAPQPDFDLLVVPSSVSLRSKANATLTVYAQRKDGFTGPIKLTLKPMAGFSAAPVTMATTQTVARLTFKTDLAVTKEPVNLSIIGTAKTGDQELVREAVPAEDRMQAFLWRHLVPAQELKVLVFDPAYQPPPKRVAPPRPPIAAVTNAPIYSSNAIVKAGSAAGTNSVAGTNPVAGASVTLDKPKFTKQQVVARLRQLKLLYEEGMLTADFYNEKAAECEAAQ
jgi:hypothetical protein